MEDYYRSWMERNPQQRLTADEEKAYGRRIRRWKKLDAEIREKGREATDGEKRIIADGREALKEFIERNIPLAIYFAGRYAAKYPHTGLTPDDISQEAVMGLMKAAERYDPEENCKFSTYAAFWIGQTVRRAIEDKGDTIRRPASAHSRARMVHRALSGEGDIRDSSEIADLTGLSEEEVEFIRQLDRRRITSLDQSLFDDDEEETAHESIPSNANVEEEAGRRMEREMLARLIGDIPDPDVREIMLMHLGLYGGGTIVSDRSIALIKHRRETEIRTIIERTEHEFIRWSAFREKDGE